MFNIIVCYALVQFSNKMVAPVAAIGYCILLTQIGSEFHIWIPLYLYKPRSAKLLWWFLSQTCVFRGGFDKKQHVSIVPKLDYLLYMLQSPGTRRHLAG